MLYDDSHYTISFGDIVDHYGVDMLLGDYPIFDEFYRQTLNDNIVKAYYTREIGFVSAKKFIYHFKGRMKLIMPRYNMLFEIKKTDFNALYNIDMTEIFEHEISSSGNTQSSVNAESSGDNSVSSNAKSTNKTSTVVSQFPNKNMEHDDIMNFKYVNALTRNDTTADSISSDKSKSNMNSNTNSDSLETSSSKETYTKKTIGSSAGLPFSKALEQFKDFAKSYALDEQIIKELSDLFLFVYS